MTNVYRIGVNIAMASNASALLSVMSKELLGVNAHVGELGKGFTRLKLAIGGALAIAGGAAIITGLVKLAEAGEKLTQVQASMAAAGVSNLDVAKATAAAWQTAAKVQGTLIEDNLSAVNHLRATFGSVSAGIALNQTYMRSAVAIGRITGQDGEPQAYSLARAVHLSGAANDGAGNITESGFAREMKLYTAMIASGGGKLTADDLFGFQKNAGSYAGNLSDQGRINMAGFLQSMGGGRAGTILASTNRALKDGVLQKGTLLHLEQMGLIDPHKVKMLHGAGGGGGSAGGNFQMLPGALKNEDQFRSDFMGWIWATLGPTLAAHGVVGADAQVNWLQHAKLTTNVTRGLAEGIRNQHVDQTEAGNVKKALGVDQYAKVMGGDFGANMKGVSTALHNFFTVVGAPLAKAAIPFLQSVAKAINLITDVAFKHPGAIKMIAGGFLVLGAALIGLGVAAIAIAAFTTAVAAGPIAVIVAGVGAVTAALVALAVLNWGAIKTAFGWLSGALTWLIHGDGQIKPGGFGAALSDSMTNPGGSPMNPSKSPAYNVKGGDVWLDGHKVGKWMDAHHAKALGGAGMKAGTVFDPSASMPLPGAPYHP